MKAADIGAALQKERLNKGMSQMELAAKAKVSQSVVSRLESGTLPELEPLRRVCRALGFQFMMKVVKKK
jgi:transcriptional regulator with XRE-family HTH domain